MKLFHISDLHLGKRVYEYSMIDDQRWILSQVLDAVERERPDALLVAGDVYDKSMPTAEAVRLFDEFLVRLAELKVETFIISGNHDSPERLAFGGRLIDLAGIHLSPVYDGRVQPFVLSDEFGRVNIWMLPFVKPANVRAFIPESEPATYTDALRAAIHNFDLDPNERNLLLTHQFVTGAIRSDSEEISVGGSDNVDSSVFASFDYVALGHIHSPQNIGSNCRYCGSPLKYSFTETVQKSITVVRLGRKGELALSELPLRPLHELRELRDSYDELTRRDFYKDTTYPDDYVHVILTDENDIPEAMAKLRVIYRRLMKLDYDNARTRAGHEFVSTGDNTRKSPLELFCELYEKQNHSELSDEQREYISGLIEQIWRRDYETD